MINSTTVKLKTAQALDFEMTSGLMFLQVAVHDGKGLDGSNNVISDDSIDATTTVTINIIDVEEVGVVTLSDDEPGVGTPLTATHADDDGMRERGERGSGRGRGTGGPGGPTSRGNVKKVHDIAGGCGLLPAGEGHLRGQPRGWQERGGNHDGAGLRGEPAADVPLDGERRAHGGRELAGGRERRRPRGGREPGGRSTGPHARGRERGRVHHCREHGAVADEASPSNFETKPSYSVTVEVHDGRDGLGNISTAVDDSKVVTVTVENVEEQGAITLTSDTATIQARVPVTAVLSDDDGPSGVTGWQWARSPKGRSDWVNISGARSATFTPTLTDDGGNYIRAYGQRTPTATGPSKTANDVSPRVGDAPPINSAPAFPSTENGQGEVAEDAGSTNIGDAVVTTGFNNDTLYYSLSGTDAASFEIGQNNGTAPAWRRA